MDNLYEVEENIIIDAQMMCKHIGESEDNFTKILDVGKDMKAKGLTPIYFYDPSTACLYVDVKVENKTLN
jgi:hypothetical protein